MRSYDQLKRPKSRVNSGRESDGSLLELSPLFLILLRSTVAPCSSSLIYLLVTLSSFDSDYCLLSGSPLPYIRHRVQLMSNCMGPQEKSMLYSDKEFKKEFELRLLEYENHFIERVLL